MRRNGAMGALQSELDKRREAVPDHSVNAAPGGTVVIMIVIKLYGLIAENSGQRQFVLNAETVREALDNISWMSVEKEVLYGALMFINGKPLTGIRRLERRLYDGDELALLSPTGGG